MLHRIEALRDIEGAAVERGTLGGWVASPDSLSQSGDCWVYPEASIADEASVRDDCRLHDRACVSGRARLTGFVLVHDDSRVEDEARVDGVAVLRGGAVIGGSAHVIGGQDGPQVMPGVFIDFDVRYGLDYVVFGYAYGGHLVAVSRSGRICLAGNWNAPRFSGDLDAFRAFVSAREDAELQQALRAATDYLAAA